MAKRARSVTDPLLFKESLQRKEEKEDKIRKTGKVAAICKGCGPLPIDRFYLIKYTDENGELSWKAQPHCKSCVKARQISMGEGKRKQYAKTQAPKNMEKYKNDGGTKRDESRARQQYGRDNLTDSYVRKRIVESGVPKNEVTNAMIIKKRAELKERRDRIARGEIKKGREYSNEMNRKSIAKLTDRYIRRMLKHKLRTKITDEMIKEERKRILEIRALRGKRGTAAMQLSDSYVARIISRSKKIPIEQVTQEEIIAKRLALQKKREIKGTILANPTPRKKKK